MNKNHRIPAILGLCSLCVLCAPSAQAEIYKYVDKDGHVTYSNVPIKGAKKITLDPINTVPASRARSEASSPSDFPKVDSDTQRRRDDTRRKVLEDELAAERKMLEEAKKALAEQEAVRLGNERNYQKFLDRVQPYKDTVTLHEKNIDALQKEIANLK
jgi:hypothetical protein